MKKTIKCLILIVSTGLVFQSCKKKEIAPQIIGTIDELRGVERSYSQMNAKDKRIAVAAIINYYQLYQEREAARFLKERLEDKDPIVRDLLITSDELGVKFPFEIKP